MPAMGELVWGTSSWSAKGWVGPFYPPGTRPTDMLGLYAERYSAVEADTTYYGIPRRETVAAWAERTPASFTLCAKFPRGIVHRGEGPRPDADSLLVWDAVGGETERFLGIMAALGPKCGPLILQFPYFNRKLFAEPGPFLERLDAYLGRLPRDFRYGVEIRNRNWVAAPLIQLLRRHRAALVLVDLAYMPHPADLPAGLDPVTSDFSYCRLIGDRHATEKLTRSFDRVVLDQGPRLARWAAFLQSLHSRVETTYVFVNNHYAGYAPGTLDDLQRLVRQAMGADDAPF
jgi:uncharacterized protein YecE (DUF72 family)